MTTRERQLAKLCEEMIKSLRHICAISYSTERFVRLRLDRLTKRKKK